MTTIAKVERVGFWEKIVIYAEYPQPDGSAYNSKIMTLEKGFNCANDAYKVIESKQFKSVLKNAEKLELHIEQLNN